MLAFSNEKTPALKANSIDISLGYSLQTEFIRKTSLINIIGTIKRLVAKIFPKAPPLQAPTIRDLEEKTKEYSLANALAAKELEDSYNEYLESLPFKKRKRYKARRWKGHSYGSRLIVHVGYLLQCYHFAFGLENKPINPSKETLAKQVGICVRTLDKALAALKVMSIIDWISGKKFWETNIYIISDAYRIRPMRRPKDFKVPKFLWLKMQYLIKKQKLKEFTKTIFEHLLGDIADHLLRRNKFLRTSQKESSESFLKTALDPPKTRKKPPNWQLLKHLKLSFKDQWVLSRYSEAVLRQALDDLSKYHSWGNTVNNTAAFLMAQCQTHQKQRKAKCENINPTSIKEWLISYFKARQQRFIFINKESQIDPATSEPRPFIQLLWHKEDLKRSVLKVYQKIQGQWIDKVFTFDRPNLMEAIETYLENSLRNIPSAS